jgi:hypothetical protein
MDMQPPVSAAPAVRVKPSTTVARVSPLVKVKARVLAPVAASVQLMAVTLLPLVA